MGWTTLAIMRIKDEPDSWEKKAKRWEVKEFSYLWKGLQSFIIEFLQMTVKFCGIDNTGYERVKRGKSFGS